MKRRFFFLLLSAAVIQMSGCGSAGTEDSTAASSAQSEEMQSADTEEVQNASDMFTDSDMEIGYDEETSAEIILSGDSAASDSDAVGISGSTVTITDEGTYILSGRLNDGMIIVSAEDSDKIRLILDGVTITNEDSAAIYIAEADKVFITTASGSENSLTNGGEYVPVDDSNIDAVIFSRSDLTLNGAGSLKIEAEAGHGIVSKDDLVLTSGSYEIISPKQGISGKDSVRIASGTYQISSGTDAIHTENTDDTGLGFAYIAGGTFSLTADGDGISAGSYIQIDGGEFSIDTGDGSASVVMSTDTMDFGQGGNPAVEESASDEEETVSQKGIKAEGTLTVTDGKFVTDTADDSFHAGGDILISGGTFELQSGDDAVHSDAAVTIQDGTFTISYCYEGIEGLTVTIDGGTFDIDSEDDGINAAGGADSSGFGGGRPGQEPYSSESDSYITINGGTFVIVSDGDCIDSNGALTINGGSLDLTCSGNGNTALDCDGTYTNNGEDVTTNDGSESNPGQMGGGMGGPGQTGDPGQMGGPGQTGGPGNM